MLGFGRADLSDVQNGARYCGAYVPCGCNRFLTIRRWTSRMRMSQAGSCPCGGRIKQDRDVAGACTRPMSRCSPARFRLRPTFWRRSVLLPRRHKPDCRNRLCLDRTPGFGCYSGDRFREATMTSSILRLTERSSAAPASRTLARASCCVIELAPLIVSPLVKFCKMARNMAIRSKPDYRRSAYPQWRQWRGS